MARLASYGYLGIISDPLIVSKFHNETHDLKGQVNKIYTIVKDNERSYRHHTVPITSCSEVKYVLKKAILWKQEYTEFYLPVESCTKWFILLFCPFAILIKIALLARAVDLECTFILMSPQ